MQLFLFKFFVLTILLFQIIIISILYVFYFCLIYLEIINESSPLFVILFIISHNQLMKNNNQSKGALNNTDSNVERMSIGSNSSLGKSKLMRKKARDQADSTSRSKGKNIFDKQGFQSFCSNYIHNSMNNRQSLNLEEPVLRKSKTAKEVSPTFKTLKKNLKIQNPEPDNRPNKRKATPVKSRRLLEKSQQKTDFTSFQQGLLVSQLQTQLQIQKVNRLTVTNNLEKKSKEVQEMADVITHLEQHNKFLQNQNSQLTRKINHLEKSILQGQNNLNAAHGALTKLRKVIKENRISELTAQIKQLNSKLEFIKEENQNLTQQNTTLSDSLKKTTRECEQLRQKVDLVSKYRTESMRESFLTNQLKKLREEIEGSKSQRQIFLEGQLKNKDEIIFNQMSEIKALSIKIHYIEHSKIKEIQELTEKKDAEIKKVRVRSSQLIQKAMNDNEKASKKQLSNSTILTRERKRSQVLLELSPEY